MTDSASSKFDTHNVVLYTYSMKQIEESTSNKITPAFTMQKVKYPPWRMNEMKYLLNIVLLGCIFFVAGNFSSQAGAACVKEFIYDCFNPDNYNQPGLSTYYNRPNPCKTWTSGTINCPGTYYMAIYVTSYKDQILTASYESTCPGQVNVEILNGDQIENILRTFPAEQLAQLSVNEIRDGKVPVFIRFKCYENGQGDVTFKIHCDYDTSGDLSPFDPAGGIRLLLLPDRDK